MPKEYEVKILDIDVDKIIKKLKNLGAKKQFEKAFTRIIFVKFGYKTPFDEWLRLRTDGKKTTLTYKKIEDLKLGGIHEIETEVEDFETTRQILKSIGLIDLLLQKNKRIEYRFKDIIYDIDFWPKLKPYLEVEADSIEKVEKGVKLLGFTMDQTTVESNELIYRNMGIDINKIKELTFDGQ